MGEGGGSGNPRVYAHPTVNKDKVEIAAFIQFVRSQRQFAGVGKIRAGLGELQIKAIDTVDPPLVS